MISITLAQRPSYAGTRPIGRPELASRFRDSDESTSNVNFENRLGNEENSERIPIDARGDYDLVQRVKQWPRENQPFWVLNSDQIEAHRNPTNTQQLQNRGDFDESGDSIPARPEIPRSPFLRPKV